MSIIIGCRIIILRYKLSSIIIIIIRIVYDDLIGVFVASFSVVSLVLITTMLSLVQIIRGTADTSLVLLRDDIAILRRRSWATVVVRRCRVSLLLSSPDPIVG